MEIVDVCIRNGDICYEGSEHAVSDAEFTSDGGFTYSWVCPNCNEDHKTACDEEVTWALMQELIRNVNRREK